MLAKYESEGLSLARGFIVLIMPGVHSVLIYSNDAVKTGWLGGILGFFAEQPGAQLFMVLMGLFVGIGKPKSTTFIIKRFLTLFLAGYVLNFFRLVLPYWWGGLPDTFLIENNILKDNLTGIYLFLTGDILQFAALGYLATQVMKRYLKRLSIKIILLVLLLSVSPFLWYFEYNSLASLYFLGLFMGTPPQTFFPFFPWICYPVFGLIVGQVVKQSHHRINALFWFILSLFFIATGFLVTHIEPLEWKYSFYRLGPGGTLFHIGVALLWMILFIFLSAKVKSNRVFNYVSNLSANITPIYLIQWVIVIWLLPVFGFNSLGTGMSLVAVIVNSIISFGIAMHLPTRLRILRRHPLPS